MNNFELCKIKLNTIELEKGIDPSGDISKYCDDEISGTKLDSISNGFFSLENKIKAFGLNYNEYNTIYSENNQENIKIPTIINGGMGTNVSSSDLVKAMNKIGFGGHLSSIGIGFYYFEDKYKNFGKLSTKEAKNIVEEEFNNIFVKKIGLNNQFITKHFFVCNELGEGKRNEGFNGELGKERTTRMMDLIAIYDTVSNLKNQGINTGINCMYKTSSYIATIKISMLAGVDYITTAAGNPTKNPKEFLADFYSDIENEGIKYKTPVFGLLISSGSKRILKDLDYDYYIFEEGDKAGGHIIRMGEKFTELGKIKEIFEKEGKIIPPIYAAGGIYSNNEIKEALENGFSGVQIGTNLAVSEEAVNGKGEEFKNRLIGGNHLGENTQIDYNSFSNINQEKEKFNKLVRFYNNKVLKYLSKENGVNYSQETPEIIKVREYIYTTIYNDFFNIRTTKINEDEEVLYNQIKEFLFKEFNGNLDQINKIMRNYGNAKKFIKEFEKFNNKENSLPTHLVFDSTVGFPGRTRIMKDMYKVVSGKIKSSGCVNCLTDCILANRGGVKEPRGSTFCIYDWLDQTSNEKNNIAFSGRSTTPYSEVRPVNDIMAYYMRTYVKR